MWHASLTTSFFVCIFSSSILLSLPSSSASFPPFTSSLPFPSPPLLLCSHLRECLQSFSPDFVLYNAGTDVLEGDSLGALSITAQGVIARDELVFREVGPRPICMVTSGGYTRQSARVIADSILNLKNKGLLTSPEASVGVSS